MLKNYQIVIFKDQHGTCRKLSLRGWVFILLLLAVVAVVVGDLTLIKYYYNYRRMEVDLAASEKTTQDQTAQLRSLADKVLGLEADLSRIRTFDGKLRHMVNLSEDPPEVAPAGSDEREAGATYPPLYRQELLTRKLHHYLNTLRDQASLELIRQQELLRVLGANTPRLASLPTDWPVAGWISSNFGERTSPFTGKKEFHKGLDIVAPVGTPVLAPGGGTVTFAGTAEGGGFSVVIDHQGGIVSSYGHLKDVAVSKGQAVRRGQCIGHVGNLGQATGPHLHYEIRQDGAPVNPKRFILR